MQTFWSIDQLQNTNKTVSALAIGDSWLWFPFGNMARSLEPLLSFHQATLVLGENGMRTKHLDKVMNEIKPIIHTYKNTIQYILISIGGNDLIGGNLYKFLRKDSDTANYANECYNLDSMQAYIKEVSKKAADFANDIYGLIGGPKTQVIIHGYGYPQASRRGIPFFKTDRLISGPMDNCGIPEKFRTHIIAIVVDEYNFWLSHYLYRDCVKYANLRHTLSINEKWFDEIHPTSRLFDSLSLKLRERIGF